MPDIMDLFPHLEGWDTIQLQARRQELRGDTTQSARQLSDDALRELSCIARLLRTRASTAKPRAEGNGSAKKVIPSLSDL